MDAISPGAYGIFLALIRLWVEIERRHFEAAEVKIDLEGDDEPEFRNISTNRSSWVDWLDVSPDFAFDEGCLPVILIAAMLGLLVLVVSAIGAAPVLVAIKRNIPEKSNDGREGSHPLLAAPLFPKLN